MSVSSVKGCVSVGQDANSYSQNAELRWDNRSIKQGMKYQVLCCVLCLFSLTVFAGVLKIYLCSCDISREVHRDCTAFRLMSAWIKCLLHPVLHTHCWLRFRLTSEIAWSTQCCWASAPHSLWVQTSVFLTAFVTHWLILLVFSHILWWSTEIIAVVLV